MICSNIDLINKIINIINKGQKVLIFTILDSRERVLIKLIEEETKTIKNKSTKHVESKEILKKYNNLLEIYEADLLMTDNVLAKEISNLIKSNEYDYLIIKNFSETFKEICNKVEKTLKNNISFLYY